MKNLYLSFNIALIAIFAICIIPLIGMIYLMWLMFVPAIGFSITNFIIGRNGANGTGKSALELATIVLAIVGLIPFLGWFCKLAALILCVIMLVQFINANKKTLENQDSVNASEETPEETPAEASVEASVDS